MMEIRGLNKSFGGNIAVRDFSLEIEDDEYLTLLGPSGSGKSTLLRLIAGLERPDTGAIVLDGKTVTGTPPHLRGLGFVQQKYGLFPHMSVFDNVAFGLRYRQIDPVSDQRTVNDRVERMLELVGLEEFGDRMVGEISGGQRQRVSLARTLICEPRICLLDEPLGALDANLRERMTVELRRIRSALGVTFMHVTGNEAEALAMGDRMIVLDAGRAIQVDTPHDIFSRPANVQVARFLNAYNILSGSGQGGAFETAGARLAMPPGVSGAVHYVFRFDNVAICDPDSRGQSGSAQMEAEFIASEFLGSRVVYFFRRPDGGVIEAEKHLSAVDPRGMRQGEKRILRWPVENVLLYGKGGGMLRHEPVLEVAQ
ncbi:ABC transporter ATP-binding protein [Nitratireductor sp. XY-223]|uniref:ABC transporter ATP-binding protein n=1 Tax=Nitratireductor sp. XY-223 TaxID=2561926 RepID=UPI0010A9DDAF|nr:ABC transporter ATP-binding protein [Nitratireductor sp. XY-223]